MKNFCLLLAASLSQCVTFLRPLTADVLFQTGFEPNGNPPYVLGGLVPQQPTPDPIGQNGWVRFGINRGVAAIESRTVFSGTQALELTGASETALHLISDPVPESLIVFEIHFLVPSAPRPAGSATISLTGTSSVLAEVTLRGGLLTFQTNTSPYSYDVWHDLKFTFDLTSSTATEYLDGAVIATGQLPGGNTGVYGLILSEGGGDLGFFDIFFDDVSIVTGQGNSPRADSFQVRYASNLDIGDSVVNITNTGASASGGAGNICANVYVFDQSEELLACCSCFATPNGLQSASVKNSLIANNLTPEIPNSVVIKLLATAAGATSGSCNAANPTAATLAGGMRAWGTSLHALPTTPVKYGVTETPFLTADLSAAELNHLITFCSFIQSNASGFGICKGCTIGGLGAAVAR